MKYILISGGVISGIGKGMPLLSKVVYSRHELPEADKIFGCLGIIGISSTASHILNPANVCQPRPLASCLKRWDFGLRFVVVSRTA